ncbi:MAG: UDP-2,3-diacylglucosamine diphosphatase [Gammaproteobacteria bacterium]|nr:UDP-2,3-diacylglucosamine diphosphatase [Gammaproteobacteria bacterium]MDH5777174.1 UDP-2,3-diacylglucosamine diphosphatase [Gammaproteobacteria bacterium]
MSTLFISDLHLSPQHPELTQLFIKFLQHEAPHAEKLYILGDLFEVWLGDDMVLPDYQQAIKEIKQLSESVPVLVMHGNRDFLMRETFAAMSGCTLLSDSEIIDLYGTPTLLLHGDTLCTDDKAYQDFRNMVRNPDWQKELLAKSPEERLALAKKYREISKTETEGKTNEIMDVNQQTVETVMKQSGVTQLIHGHTHRPAIHDLKLDNQNAKRIVLGDWQETQGSMLVCDSSACELRAVTLNS